jgi:hypothetical protein
MRNELELMETIEKYLKGNLSETEKIAFEKRIAAEPELKKEVQLQKELMKGIERTAIKQSAKQGLKKYKFNKNLKNWGLTGLTIAVITASAFVFYNSVVKNTGKENAANELPALNEEGGKLWSDADKYLPLQNFELDAEKDTVVETKDGIVIAIPAHSFLDANGQPATGTIQLEVKEALKAADIMKAGLNTKSGDKLLETGGMFYINARKDDASLKIDPKNALYAEIPANEVKPNMQLFEGKRLPDGTIDWVNPKPIVKDLIPVDIFSLNFYPPNYLDSLKSWGYNIKDKKFTDSLYYSFASMFGIQTDIATPTYQRTDTAKSAKKDPAVISVISSDINRFKKASDSSRGYLWTAIGTNAKNKPNVAAKKTPDILPIQTSSFITYSSGFISEKEVVGINPAKIKTIWNEKFQNTLLATREFEERLPVIFESCNENILDLYINNLDKNLSSIDSIAGEWETSGYQKFRDFAARGDGKVRNGNKNVELLKAYYAQKSKIFTEAITKTRDEFWKKQSETDIQVKEKKRDYSIKDIQRLNENFQKELNLNLTTISGQLNNGILSRSRTYGVTITTSGWKNCDRNAIFIDAAIVNTATKNRITLNYTIPQANRTAVIKYEPLTVSINDYKSYDRILVYLLPDELNSFVRAENKNELFEEKLNELMIYKMVCIAYNGDKSFYFSQDNIKPGALNVSLVKTANADIQNNVNKLKNLSQVKAMNDELNYMAFEKEETKRQVELSKINELTNKVRPVIFPCMPAPIAKADTIATARK